VIESSFLSYDSQDISKLKIRSLEGSCNQANHLPIAPELEVNLLGNKCDSKLLLGSNFVGKLIKSRGLSFTKIRHGSNRKSAGCG